MTKPTQLETALYEAAKLLYAYEQRIDTVGEPNIYRQNLGRCARDAGYKSLSDLYDAVDSYWRDEDEAWEGVYP